jgi:predicted amidophosphoribosyltransferase
MFIDHAINHCAVLNPILVPVPSKDGLISAVEFRALTMVQESVTAIGKWQIAPVLRFNRPLQPAYAGGPRGRAALQPYMTVTHPIPAGPIILVDDILTTGGTLLASYDALLAVGRAPAAAIICGHTVSDSLLSAFGHHQKNIDPTPQQIVF